MYLYLSKIGVIWVSNDSGKVGVIDFSGKDKRLIEIFFIYFGYFILVIVYDEKSEDIYWVYKKKKVVIKNEKFEYEIYIGKWILISIFFLVNLED